MIKAIILSMRPKQWIKNLFVFAGLLFTLDYHHAISDYTKVALTFAVFCILSGVVYLINDILDVAQDRNHPTKSQRPIAAKKLSEKAAWASVGFLLPVGIAGSFLMSIELGEVALLYTGLLTAYSLFLKNIVILDVMTIAAGFVLRAVAGAVAIQVGMSPWLLICTILIALFIGLAKQRGELSGLREEAENHRSTLADYSLPLLDQLISITAASTIIAYALYTFFSETGKSHPYMMATLPFVIYGVFRYLMLIHENDGSAAPELLLLKDKPLQVDIGLWALTCALIVAMS